MLMTALVVSHLTFVAAPAPYLEKDMADLVALWSGQWSNDRQTFFAADAGMATENMAPLQEFSLTSAQDASPAAATYGARWAVEEDRIVQTLVGPDGRSCTTVWQRDGAQFEGQGGSTCDAVLALADTRRPSGVRMVLSSESLGITQRQRSGPDIQSQFRKVRPFSCWVAVLRGASHGDSGEGQNDWFFARDVAIHDQGGIATVATDETPSRSLRLRLRDVDWTYGTRRPSLTLYVLGEDDRAVSYSWTDGGADRIGINLRWMQASCTRLGADD